MKTVKAFNDVVVTGFGTVMKRSASLHDVRLRSAEHRDADLPSLYDWHEFDPTSIIEKRPHIRGMSEAQIASTFAAGIALKKSGILGNTLLLEKISMLVTCSGNHRDTAFDEEILLQLAWSDKTCKETQLVLNKMLQGMRPTLFLTQLQNLFPANISISLGVTGESITLLGDEDAGINALKLAHHRIASGRNAMVLVGGVFNGEDKYLNLLYQAGAFGRPLSSSAAYLVVESLQHAKQRGAHIYARLPFITQQRIREASSGAVASIKMCLQTLPGPFAEPAIAVLASTCAEQYAWKERALWQARFGEENVLFDYVTPKTGYLREATFITQVNLALQRFQDVPHGSPGNGSASIVVSNQANDNCAGLAVVEAFE